MPATKTSDESAASTLDGSELVRIVQSGAMARTTTQEIADLIQRKTQQQAPVVAVSTDPLPGTPTYSNGTGGTGATLTASSNGVLVVDGVSFATLNARVIVAGQADPTENGVFSQTQIGDGSHPYILTRATDWDGDTVAAGGVQLGDTFMAYQGDTNIGVWVFSSNSSVGAVVFGTSELGFTKIASVVDITTIISNEYKIGFSSPQTTAYTASQVVGHHSCAAAITIPANFGSYLGLASQAGGSANTTASTVFSVEQAAAATPNTFSQIGTITFASGTVTPTFATSSGTAKNLAAGDVLRIVAPSSPDSTFAGFYATLIASRQ